jgi:hypothetical protein
MNTEDRQSTPIGRPLLDDGVRNPHLGPAHPLAEVAATHCARHRPCQIAGTACGACWERAIRDDERFAVECGLPRKIEPDPDYVDEIAVDLACRGEQVTLTATELRDAVARLSRRGLFPVAIARRLRVSYDAVIAAMPPQRVRAA